MKSWLSAPKNGAQGCHGLDQGVKSGRLRIKEIRQFVMAITAFRHASSIIPQYRGRSFPGRAKGDDHAHSVDCGVRRYTCNASGRLGAVAALRGKRATSASPRYSVVMAALRAFFATQTVRKEIQPTVRSLTHSPW
jgi:hypothetical protein